VDRGGGFSPIFRTLREGKEKKGGGEPHLGNRRKKKKAVAGVRGNCPSSFLLPERKKKGEAKSAGKQRLRGIPLAGFR